MSNFKASFPSLFKSETGGATDSSEGTEMTANPQLPATSNKRDDTKFSTVEQLGTDIGRQEMSVYLVSHPEEYRGTTEKADQLAGSYIHDGIKAKLERSMGDIVDDTLEKAGFDYHTSAVLKHTFNEPKAIPFPSATGSGRTYQFFMGTEYSAADLERRGDDKFTNLTRRRVYCPSMEITVTDEMVSSALKNARIQHP